MSPQILHLAPTSMLEILVTVAIIAVAVAITLVTLAVVVPPLYREARTWLPPTRPSKVVNIATRRRALAAAVDLTSWRRMR